MASDPKSNSVVGIFKQDAKPGTRESYPLIGAIPVAIEALDVEQVGNNCQWNPKPHIINATNVDTETVLGQIGIQALSTIIQEQVNNVDWETISYGDIDADGLPESAGIAIQYCINTVLWIGEYFNGETDAEIADAEDAYLGMDHLLPTMLTLTSTTGAGNGTPIYVPRMSYVGVSCSIFGHGTTNPANNNQGSKPRSFLLISFPFVTLKYPNGSQGNHLYLLEYKGQVSHALYPRISGATLPARIDKITQIFDVDPDGPIIMVTVVVSDAGLYKRIQAGSYDPKIGTIYYTLVYATDPNYANFTEDDVTFDNPGIEAPTLGFYLIVRRTCKVVLCQKISYGVIEKSEAVTVEVALTVPHDPEVTFYEHYDYDTHTFSDVLSEPYTFPCYLKLARDGDCVDAELVNTKMCFGYNNVGTSALPTGDLHIPYGENYDYNDNNPPYIDSAAVPEDDGVAYIYAQTVPINEDTEQDYIYCSGQVLCYEAYEDADAVITPVPVVTPTNAVHYTNYPNLWPELFVSVPQTMAGGNGVVVKYAWREPSTTMDPTEGLECDKPESDYNGGDGWDSITTYTTSGLKRVYQYPDMALCPEPQGASSVRTTLYICFTKTGWDTPPESIGSYTYVFVSENPRSCLKGLSKDGIEIVSDGFDNKLISKNIEMLKIDSVSGTTIRFSLSPIVAPAINNNFEEYQEPIEGSTEEPDADRMSSSNNLPAFSQTFLVTPLVDSYEKYTCILTVNANHRKQLRGFPPDMAPDALDIYLVKKRFLIYGSDEVEVYINLYREDILNTYRYCFSIVNLVDGTETYPNNFSSDVISSLNEPRLFVSRIQVLDKLASGLCRVVITYSIGETTAEGYGTKNFIAYLELSYLSDYYPEMSGCRIEPSILSEVIVNSDDMTPDRMVTPISSVPNFNLTGPYVNTDIIGTTFRRVLDNTLPQKQISARLLFGNSLALTERYPVRTRQYYIDMTLTYGAQCFTWTDMHCSSAHFPWKDGVERYATAYCLPVVFPINALYFNEPLMLYPEKGFQYDYKKSGTWNPNDPFVFYTGSASWDHDVELNYPLSEDWGNIANTMVTMEMIHKNLGWAHKLLSENGVPYTGTLICIQPPAILPGGAYNATGLALTELNLEVIKKKLVYGDEVGPATLSSNAGIFSLSNWPYMSDNSKRLSQIGVTAQSTVLENYIFSIENGYACVYFINEQQGKNLLFNELGKFLDFPIIFKGVPYFGITNHNGIIIYRLDLSNRPGLQTHEGITAIRKFPDETHGVMLHISGHNPILLIRKSGVYESWALDNNAVYKTGSFSFNQPVEIKRISGPTGTTAILVTEQNEHIIEHKSNDNMSIESSEIYPSMLSYEYEQYTFVVNKVVLRFDVQEIQPAGPVKRTSSGRNPNTQVFNISVKANNDTILYAQTEVKALSETIICLDATPVKSLSYTITSKVPVRSVRFTGHFIEDLKVE